MNKPKAVAWIHFFKNGGFQITPIKKYPKDFPLYFAPPQREWHGLTDEDKNQIAKKACNKAELTAWELAQRVGEFTEAKLKEKNT